MAAYTITASQVQPDADGNQQTKVANVAITPGQAVYQNGAKWDLAENGDTVAKAAAKGIALNTAAAGQPCTVQTSGSPVLGADAAVPVGEVVVVGTTAGDLEPEADLVTGEKVTPLGVGVAGNAVKLGINATGEDHA